MMAEKRFLAGIDDLRAIEFTCKKCKAGTTRILNEERNFVPTQCSNCNQPWMINGGVLEQAIRALFKAVRTIRELQNEAIFQLKIEITAEGLTPLAVQKSALEP